MTIEEQLQGLVHRAAAPLTDLISQLRAVCDKAEPMWPATMETDPADSPSRLCVPMQDVLAVLDGSTGLLCPAEPVTPPRHGVREAVPMTVPTPGPPISRPPCDSTSKAVDGSTIRCVGHLGHPEPHSDGRALRWTDRYIEVRTPEEPTVAAYRVFTRRAELLDAIAQAIITIQRSVVELEQMEAPRPRCGACGAPEGAECSPACPTCNITEQRYCGQVAQATGVEVKCDHPAGHLGPHRRGEMTWPNQHAVCQASTAATGEAGTLWYCVRPAGHDGRHARGAASW